MPTLSLVEAQCLKDVVGVLSRDKPEGFHETDVVKEMIPRLVQAGEVTYITSLGSHIRNALTSELGLVVDKSVKPFLYKPLRKESNMADPKKGGIGNGPLAGNRFGNPGDFPEETEARKLHVGNAHWCSRLHKRLRRYAPDKCTEWMAQIEEPSDGYFLVLPPEELVSRLDELKSVVSYFAPTVPTSLADEVIRLSHFADRSGLLETQMAAIRLMKTEGSDRKKRARIYHLRLEDAQDMLNKLRAAEKRFTQQNPKKENKPVSTENIEPDVDDTDDNIGESMDKHQREPPANTSRPDAVGSEISQKAATYEKLEIAWGVADLGEEFSVEGFKGLRVFKEAHKDCVSKEDHKEALENALKAHYDCVPKSAHDAALADAVRWRNFEADYKRLEMASRLGGASSEGVLAAVQAKLNEAAPAAAKPWYKEPFFWLFAGALVAAVVAAGFAQYWKYWYLDALR